MRRIVSISLAVLCFGVLAVTAAFAGTLKKVYLMDGGVIECESFWKADGKVMVRVNRDVLVDLSQDEVDLGKTFAKKPAKPVRKKAAKARIKTAAARPPVQKAVTSVRKAAQPATAAKPVQGVATGAKKPAPAAAKPAQPKPAPAPPPEKSFLQANLTNIALGALLLLLVVALVLRKRGKK